MNTSSAVDHRTTSPKRRSTGLHVTCIEKSAEWCGCAERAAIRGNNHAFRSAGLLALVAGETDHDPDSGIYIFAAGQNEGCGIKERNRPFNEIHVFGKEVDW